MWLTSKTPTAWRTALCSSMIPEYWTGMSHPPKSTILAPSTRWTEFKGVRRRAGAAGMKAQPNSPARGCQFSLLCAAIHTSGRAMLNRAGFAVPNAANALTRAAGVTVLPAARERDAPGLCPESDGRSYGLGLTKSGGMERLEALSDAEDGLDVLIGIAAQLLAEPAQVDVI